MLFGNCFKGVSSVALQLEARNYIRVQYNSPAIFKYIFLKECLITNFQNSSEAYFQTTLIEIFAKISNSCELLFIFEKDL